MTHAHLKGDGPLYEAVSRKASPEAHALIDAMMKEVVAQAHEIEQEDMVRALVEIIYPQFPPFLLTQEGLDDLTVKIRRNRHLSRKHINHLRQQAMLSEALAANRRGESVAYLLDFLPRNKKRKKK